MFIELLSKSCEKGEESLYWVTKMSHYFWDKFSLNLWLSFTSYFSQDKPIGLAMPFFTGHIWEVSAKEIIVMIIKHRTYTHCTFKLHTGCPKKFARIREQYIVGSPFNFVFVRVSDKTQKKCNNDSFIQIYN